LIFTDPNGLSEAYMGYFERFIVEHKLANVFMVNPARENDYLGFDQFTLMKHLSPAILLADILVEIDNVLRVVGASGSLEQFQQAWERLRAGVETLDEFTSLLRRLSSFWRNYHEREIPWHAPGLWLRVISSPASAHSSWMVFATFMRRGESFLNPSISPISSSMSPTME